MYLDPLCMYQSTQKKFVESVIKTEWDLTQGNKLEYYFSTLDEK